MTDEPMRNIANLTVEELERLFKEATRKALEEADAAGLPRAGYGGCACTSIDRSHCQEPECKFSRS